MHIPEKIGGVLQGNKEEMEYTFKHKQFPPKTSKQVKEERIEVITKAMGGNLLRFLRNNYKHQRYQLTYSRVLPKWEEQGKSNLVKALKDKYPYPRHLIEIVSVVRTMVKYYGYKLEVNTIKLAEVIVDLFEDDIYNYTKKRLYSLREKTDKLYLVNPKQALREQKARGFIHINDFEDFKKRKNIAHVYSLVNPDYIYPVNFRFGVDRDMSKIDVYVGQYLTGVEGFTRIVLPKLY